MFVLALRTNLHTILRTILHAILRTILRAILHAKLVPTFSTRVDLHAWQAPCVLMLHVEIYTRADLHACKFPHVTSTRVELVTRVNLHAWKKWVRAWRGGLCEGSGHIFKSASIHLIHVGYSTESRWCKIHYQSTRKKYKRTTWSYTIYTISMHLAPITMRSGCVI